LLWNSTRKPSTHSNGTICNDLKWPVSYISRFQRRSQSRGLSATDEFLVGPLGPQTAHIKIAAYQNPRVRTPLLRMWQFYGRRENQSSIRWVRGAHFISALTGVVGIVARSALFLPVPGRRPDETNGRKKAARRWLHGDAINNLATPARCRLHATRPCSQKLTVLSSIVAQCTWLLYSGTGMPWCPNWISRCGRLSA